MSRGYALVVGGNGFLGRYAANALAEHGYEIVVLDRAGSESNTPPEAPPHPEGTVQITGSTTDPRDLQEAAAERQPAVICTLAAYGYQQLGLVAAAEHSPRDALSVNLMGLLNVLELGEATGARVIWTSSTTVYGPADTYDGLVDEESPVRPGSLYAATKIAGEQLVRTYRSRGVDAVAMRPTLVWGPGIRYRGVQAALGDMVESAATQEPITVASVDEPWDLLYVADAGRALAHIATCPDTPDVVLINGYRASITDVRDAVLAARPEAHVDLDGVAPSLDFPHVSDRQARDLGFSPAYDLKASVEDYLDTIARTGRRERQ